MIVHMQALKVSTEALWPTYLWQAPMKSPTQFLIWQSPSGGAGDELPVAQLDDGISTPVRLLARAATGEAVAIMLRKVQELLSPGKLPSPLEVDGRHVTIRWERAEFIAPDVDAVVDATGRNPFYGIDTYHLLSQPTGA